MSGFDYNADFTRRTRNQHMSTEPGPSSPETNPESPAPPGRHRRRLFLAGYIAFLLVLALVTLKLVRVEADVYEYYYPELRSSGVLDTAVSRDDDTFDVLTLGASVLFQVEDGLERRLQRDLDGRVRCFHLSTTAHTSRDSRLKYSRLAGRQFDLVMVCHGINDVRMNYWPADEFRDDYAHCRWYANLRDHEQAGTLSLWDRLASHAHQEGLGPPLAADYVHGETLKTGQPFERNLVNLVHEAAGRDDPVLLLTMASYIPEDYSRARFDAGQLDYGPGDVRHAAELWGRPDQVASGIAEHNRRSRLVADWFDNVTLLDIAARIPADGRHFCDPCHLTAAGQRRFVDDVAAVIVELLTRDRE